MSAGPGDIRARVLRMFREWGREALDLHELFEAGDSNDPDARREVFYAVEGLVEEGLLEERGNDFYALSAEGARALEEDERGEGRGPRPA